MKKSIITAAIIAATSASTAMADGFYADAGIEYGVESETFDVELGANYEYKKLSINTDFNFDAYQNLKDTEFTGVDIGASYAIAETVSVYVTAEFDDNLDYTETLIGVNVKF